jgi:hypothetical protein
MKIDFCKGHCIDFSIELFIEFQKYVQFAKIQAKRKSKENGRGANK